jgi:hypothetical protein
MVREDFMLLKSKKSNSFTERTSELVRFTFSFISEQGLVGVNRPADDYFPAWYYAVSKKS